MPTTVVSSIGTTGRDYSTLQAWEDACPANLVTDDKIWKGECYNDSPFTAGLVISGQTTDSTRYVWLTCAAGQSFADHASVRSNPLVYDQSKGVGIEVGAGGATAHYIINGSTAHTLIERLQVNRTNATGYDYGATIGLVSGSPQLVRDCICAVTGGGASRPILHVGLGTVVNTLAYATVNAVGAVMVISAAMLNCTVIGLSGSSTYGLQGSYHSGTVKNCAIFGFTTPDFAVNGSGCSYNATDAASIVGTSSLTSQTFANCFESTTADFRLKAGSPLIDAGNTDATNAPNDITGTARDATTDGDIGAWEYTAGGGGGTDMPEHLLRARRPGVTWINDRGA